MTVETEIIDLKQQLDALQAQLSATTQSLSDTLSAHGISITEADQSAYAAQEDATTANTDITLLEILLKQYVDNKTALTLDAMHDDVVAQMVTLQATLELILSQDFQNKLDAHNVYLDSTLTQAQWEASQAAQSYQDARDLLNSIVNIDLPDANSKINQIQTKTDELYTNFTDFLTGFSDPSLLYALDSIESVTIPAALETYQSAYFDATTGQLKSSALSAYYTITDTDQAITAAVDDMRATIEDPNGSSIGATLTQNYLTAVQTNNAISSATTALQSSIEDPAGSSLGATLSNEYRTAVLTDQAISTAIQELDASLTTDIGSLTADINSIKGLSVSPTEAFGAFLNQLNVDANGYSATVASQGSAIATMQGNLASGYLIKAQAGNAVSLIDLVAADGSGGTPTSVIKISADNIILDGTVITNSIALNAVTIPVASVASGSNANVTFSISGDAPNTPVILVATWYFAQISWFRAYIYRNGSTIFNQLMARSSGGINPFLPITATHIDYPGPGTHTYTLGFSYDDANTAVPESTSLFAMGAKR